MDGDAGAFYQALFETTLDGILVMDDEGKVIDVNPSMGRLLKAPRERLIGVHFTEYVPAELRPTGMVHFIELQAAGSSQGEFPMQALDGSLVELEWSCRAHFVPGLHLCVVRDVTDRKRAAEALRESEGRFRALARHAPVGIFLTDAAGNCLFVNDRWQEMAGLTAEEAQGQGWARALYPEDRERVFEEWYSAAGAGREFAAEYRFQTPQGKITWLYGSAAAQRDEHGLVVEYIGTVTDITARKEAEAALRQREQLYRGIVETANEGIWMLDPELRTAYVNPQMAAMLGYTEAEMLGRPVFDFVPPEDLDDLGQRMERRRRGAREQYEARYQRKDGSRIWVVIGTTPLLDEQGQFLGALAMFTDITERKLAEEALRESAEDLARADQRKDQFLAMLAHELRNPLAPLRNALHLLRLQGGDPAAVERLRQMMDRQVGHMARLMDDLLDVSRISRGKIRIHPERLDLGQLVRVTMEDHQGALQAAGLAAEVELPETPVWVQGDATRLTQVLDNLLENARKFTDRGGAVRVQLRVEEPEEQVVLTVADTGMGIQPEMLPLLFDVFAQADHSLDRSRGGLGLGLALVKGLVELHGGSVQARSKGLGQGAEFLIRLSHEPEPPALTDRPTALTPGPTGLHLLIVEDNEDAAESLRLLLQAYGFTVVVAHSGPTGLEAATRTRPDIVLCDIGLPGMDGYAVARALRQDPQSSGIRLIAVTGYGQDEDVRRAREAGFDAHMVKPVDPEQLLANLERGPAAPPRP